MRVFIREPSARFYFLPVKMRTHGQNIISSRTKCWLHLLLFITYAHIVRPSQSVLSARDLNLVFVWIGDAKGAVVACPGCIRSLADCWGGGNAVSEDGGLKDSEASEAHFQGQVGQ